MPAANAATVGVATFGQLSTALDSGCSNGDVVEITADIAEGTTSQSHVSCDLTLDLNGHRVQVGTIWITSGRTLTIEDAPAAPGPAGQLLAIAGNTSYQAGIGVPLGATLIVDGGAVTATGGRSSAGIGGSWLNSVDHALNDNGTVIINGGTVSALGSGSGETTSNGAGIGGALFGRGGVIDISGGSVNAWSGDPSLGIAPRGAAIGGGAFGTAGTITISGDAVVGANRNLTSGGTGGAGIGSGENGGDGGTITIKDSSTVTAIGGTGSGSGIGGGLSGSGGVITIQDDASVTATGGQYAAGIGGGSRGSGGTITIAGGSVTATGGLGDGGQGGAGIGGGSAGSGGTVTITGDSDVTANGSRMSAGIGGGYGLGTITGAALSVGAGSTVAASGGNSIGSSTGGSAFGSLDLTGTLTLSPPPASGNGGMEIPDSLTGDEVTIAATGVLQGSTAGADGSTSGGLGLRGAGQVMNHGAITLASDLVEVTVKDHNYQVGFDTQGGSTAPAAVRVYASSFSAGMRSLPTPPTRAGKIFTGWNTAADGTGTTLTATSTLPGSSSTGSPVALTVYAQWTAAPVVPVAPTITGAATASGTVGTDFSYSPTLTGTPAPTVTAGALPPGLVLDPASGSITGRPTLSGTYAVTLTATNSEGSATKNLTITVAGILPSAPEAPTASLTGPRQITLVWTAPPAPDGHPVTGYSVTPYADGVAQPATTLGQVTSAVFPGLTRGTTYTFQVTATNDAGDGPASDLSAGLVVPMTSPGAPTGLRAVARNGEVTLTWVQPSDDGGAAITHYVITAYASGRASRAITVGNVRAAAVSGLSNGITYTFAVAARNAVGTGKASAPVAAKPVKPVISIAVSNTRIKHGKKVTVKGVSTPTLSGRVNVQQRKRVHGKLQWVTIASGRLAGGTYSVPVKLRAKGVARLRVLTVATPTASAVISTVKIVKVT
jgi:uncharacterized repeat protein (TIGR02543 family)